MNTETTEELLTLTKEFEASPAYTLSVKADALELVKSMVAQTVFAQADAFTTLKASLAAKYADDTTGVSQYLRATVLVVVTYLEEYAQDKLRQLQKRGSNAIA